MKLPRLPLSEQLRAADRGEFKDDLVAGLITAVLLVPQGMAYALLAGLPPQTGLYAAIFPPVFYALLGSSRALAVGPVAVAALMVASALNTHIGDDMALRVTGATVLAVEIGLLLIALGWLRAGVLVNFISHPVLAGFTTGAALMIMLAQFKHFAGVSVSGDNAVSLLHSLWSQREAVLVVPMLFGVVAVVVLLLGRRPLIGLLERFGLSQQHAAMVSRIVPLVVVIAGTFIAAQVSGPQLAIVGDIPRGLPLPFFDFAAAQSLWLVLAPSALLIAFVAYVESVSVAKVLATRRRQKLNSNHEFHALGAANLAAGLLSAMPVAGGFARSMVNFDSGARTQVATLVAASAVLVVTLFFTAALYYLPNAVLAAIIVVAVSQLIDIRGGRRVWTYSRGDGAAFVVTAVGVLLVGVEAGLVVGVAISMGLYLWRTGRPHIAVVGRVPGTTHFRNVDRHQVQQLPGVVMVRPDADLYFANASAVEDFLMQAVSSRPGLHHLLLQMTAVNSIDSTGLEMLENLEHNLERAGITLCLTEVKGPVMDRLQRTELGAALAPGRVFLSNERAWDALASAEARERQRQERYDTWII